MADIRSGLYVVENQNVALMAMALVLSIVSRTAKCLAHSVLKTATSRRIANAHVDY